MKPLKLAALLCLPLSVWAQTPPANLPPPPVSAMARQDNNLGSLRDKLQLQDAQLPLWQRYESSINAYIELHYQQRPVVAAQGDAAPAQLRRLVDQQSNRLAALEDIESAAKALYAALKPEQQATANQLLLATIPTIGGGSAGDPQSRERSAKPDGNRGGHRPAGMAGMGGPGGMGR